MLLLLLFPPKKIQAAMMLLILLMKLPAKKNLNKGDLLWSSWRKKEEGVSFLNNECASSCRLTCPLTMSCPNLFKRRGSSNKLNYTKKSPGKREGGANLYFTSFSWEFFFCSVSSSFPLKPSTLTAGKGGDTGERHSFPLTFQLFFAFLSSVVFLPFCFRHFRELRGARKPLSLAERRGRKKTNENGFPPVVVFLQRSTIPSKQR